jgi:plastocyanin domain-containing protein
MKLITTSVLVAALAAFGITGCDTSGSSPTEGSPSGPAASETSAAKTVAVAVDGNGFTPSKINVKQNQDVTLRFTRTTDATCAKKVVFPELKLTEPLPLNEAVDIKVPSERARTLAFQCGMGMYKSAVVIN